MKSIHCVFLLFLSRVKSQEVSTPSSQLLPRHYNHHAFDAVQFLKGLNPVKPTKQGPVLFPNDGPPPPRPPLIVTSRPLTESIARSELGANNTETSQSQVNGVSFVPYLARVKDYRPYVPSPNFKYVVSTIIPYTAEVKKSSLNTLERDNRYNDYEGPRREYEKYENNDVGAEYDQNNNYAFSYRVNDKQTGDDFSHSQHSRGSATNGEYRVRLPDGRMQIVSYTADENGYKADVRYDDIGIDQNDEHFRDDSHLKGEIGLRNNNGNLKSHVGDINSNNGLFKGDSGHSIDDFKTVDVNRFKGDSYRDSNVDNYKTDHSFGNNNIGDFKSDVYDNNDIYGNPKHNVVTQNDFTSKLHSGLNTNIGYTNYGTNYDDITHNKLSPGLTHNTYKHDPFGVKSDISDHNYLARKVQNDQTAHTNNHIDQNNYNNEDYSDRKENINLRDDYYYPDSKEFKDYSAEYNHNYQPHISKYNQFVSSTVATNKIAVKPSYEELKPLFVRNDVYNTAHKYDPTELGGSSTARSLVDTTEHVVIIGTKPPNLYTNIHNSLKHIPGYNAPKVIQATTPQSYLVSTIASLKSKINLATKPVLSDSYIEKIKKYLSFK